MTATARHYMRDLVYGANDGIITTFAVVAGIAGGALSPATVLIVGAANLAADPTPARHGLGAAEVLLVEESLARP